MSKVLEADEARSRPSNEIEHHNARTAYVGKDILELLSVSMYVEPLTMYREYIQNSTDSIDEASRVGGDGPLIIAGSAAETIAAAATQRGREVSANFADLLPEATALALMAPALPVVEGALIPLYLRPPDAKPQDGKAIARAEP